MTLLVLGRSGQLARCLAEAAAARGLALRCAGRDEADLAVPGAAAELIRSVRPEAVINAAAHTGVDACETERDRAYRLNAEAPGEAAAAAAEVGAPFLQVSTDYVFSGSGPHAEGDPTAPLNVYGASKLAGEQAVRAAAPDHHLIIRTSWLYAATGHNFVRTMLRLAATRDELSVVDDQRGAPTEVAGLAEALLDLLPMLREPALDWQGRILHLRGSGEGSWADFAEAIFAASAAVGGPSARVRRVTSDEFPTPARRPPDGRLDDRLTRALTRLTLPAYGDVLPTLVPRMLDEQIGA